MNRTFPLLALLAFAGAALGATALIPSPKANVTVPQIQAATSPIAVASLMQGGKTYDLRCAGADATLRCEIFDPGTSLLVVTSADLKFCQSGTSVVMNTITPGWSAQHIALPGNVVPPKSAPKCPQT